ncbi:MAG: acyltransferase family protein [Hyphomicrobiales bacterium]|nr:acyltransferase family protein [Hyphomicrobiales bacterium]
MRKYFSDEYQSLWIAVSAVVLFLYALFLYFDLGEELYKASKGLAAYEWRRYLGISKRFLLQWGHMVFLFVLLVASKYVFHYDRHLLIPRRVLQVLTLYSVAVFMFHFPLLYFFAAVTGHDPHSYADQARLLGLVLVASVLLGRACLALAPAFERTKNLILRLYRTRVLRHYRRPAPVPFDFEDGRFYAITESHSNVLDVVKLVATAAVVLGHFSFREFSDWNFLGFDGSAPRFAVPAFFMMSGYFAMMSIDRKADTAPEIIFKRYWSLYYLVVPMVILTPILDHVGFRVDPAVYRHNELFVSADGTGGPAGPVEFLYTFVNSVLYLNEVWIYNLLGLRAEIGGMRTFSNDAFWFMCYLMPFSVLLAVGARLRGLRRAAVLAALCLFFGPPMLLLFPLFLAGALAYGIHKHW